MKNEDKQLLLKDLCARLPYGVKVESVFINPDTKERKPCGIEVFNATCLLMIRDGLGEFKPYLRPMHSMTEDEKCEYNRLRDEVPTFHYEWGDVVEDMELHDNWGSIDYLIANHFDYRGLIPMGLANNAVGLNIY